MILSPHTHARVATWCLRPIRLCSCFHPTPTRELRPAPRRDPLASASFTPHPRASCDRHTANTLRPASPRRFARPTQTLNDHRERPRCEATQRAVSQALTNPATRPADLCPLSVRGRVQRTSHLARRHRSGNRYVCHVNGSAYCPPAVKPAAESRSQAYWPTRLLQKSTDNHSL